MCDEAAADENGLVTEKSSRRRIVVLIGRDRAPEAVIGKRLWRRVVVDPPFRRAHSGILERARSDEFGGGPCQRRNYVIFCVEKVLSNDEILVRVLLHGRQVRRALGEKIQGRNNRGALH